MKTESRGLQYKKDSPDAPFGLYPYRAVPVADSEYPNPLQYPDGSFCTTAADWLLNRRSQILNLFSEYEYGQLLPRPDSETFELISEKNNVFGKLGFRREIRITCRMNNGQAHSCILLLYLPASARKNPVPAFAGLNFSGNHTVTNEDDVLPTGPYSLSEAPRGIHQERLCVETALKRGYATATLCYQDIFRDKTDCTDSSIFRLFFTPDEFPFLNRHHTPIGAWAWGLSRIFDCLEAQPEIKKDAIAVYGHSRLGKTALWAGATDPRFAIVISNCSGCGGGAVHRRKYGENLSQHFYAHIRNNVPCWFVKKLENYIFQEEKLPIDQHELLALIAPRPVCLGTAVDDFNADPEGEFTACRLANPVYQLFGSCGIPFSNMPPTPVTITGDISFHCRPGGHEQTAADWNHYFDIADCYLLHKQPI